MCFLNNEFYPWILFRQNIGESILYLWVEKIRDVLVQKSQTAEPGETMRDPLSASNWE